MLKDISVRVTTTTDEGVPVSHNFEKVKIDLAKDLEFEFPIPSKLKRIEIEIASHVTTMLSKKKERVSKSEIIEFNLCEGKN